MLSSSSLPLSPPLWFPLVSSSQLYSLAVGKIGLVIERKKKSEERQHNKPIALETFHRTKPCKNVIILLFTFVGIFINQSANIIYLALLYVYMGQKDKDGYYDEQCHFFSTSELKYTNFKTGPKKSKNVQFILSIRVIIC